VAADRLQEHRLASPAIQARLRLGQLMRLLFGLLPVLLMRPALLMRLGLRLGSVLRLRLRQAPLLRLGLQRRPAQRLRPALLPSAPLEALPVLPWPQDQPAWALPPLRMRLRQGLSLFWQPSA